MDITILGKVNATDVGIWIMGAAALVAAGFYFYFGIINRKKSRARLIELLFIVLVVIVIIWPLASAGNVWDGAFLASLGLLVYAISRLITNFK